MANTIIERLRARLDRSANQAMTRAVSRARELAGREAFSFAAEIPGWKGGEPLWRIKVEMLSDEREDGGRLRFRAHVQSRLASAVAALPAQKAATAALPPPEAGRTLATAERAANLIRRGLEVPALRRAAAPLLRHDLDSWIELRASTADLLDGARALLPESEQLRALGIDTVAAGDGPLVQTWAGATGGQRPGFAQVSLLQLDKRHLPKSVAALLGGQPFQLVAAVVNVAEEKLA